MIDAAPVRAEVVSRESALATFVRGVAIVVIFAGIFLRFSGLDRKLFSFDEATTSIRTAGYMLETYGRTAFSGRVVDNATFLKYQHVDRARPAGDVVRSLAVEDPQHPPLYYLLERGWSSAFGNSVTSRRAVSAIAGTLMLGAAFWLCVELFGSIESGLVAAALLAVSPFFLIYSQQAREYTLWGLLTALSSALLVRAMRDGGVASWMLYATAATAGLYSDLLFVYVLVGHAVYVLLVAFRERRRQIAVGYIAASVAAVAAFSPWLLAVYRGRALLTNNDYLGVPLPAKIFALKWAFNIGAVFFDLDYEKVALGVVLLPLFLLVLYAFAELTRTTPARVWLLVYALATSTALALVLPDFVRHESRSSAARYLVPTWLAIELAVAYVLGRSLLAPSSFPRRAAAGCVFAAVVTCGLASAFVDGRGETTWAEGKSIAGLGPISRILNAAPQPTMIYVADSQRFDFASLAISNELAPGVRVLQLAYGVNTQAARNIRHGGYVLDPTPRVRTVLAGYGAVLTPVYEDRDTSPAAIQNLRSETAAVRRSHGEDVSGLSLWSIAWTDS